MKYKHYFLSDLVTIKYGKNQKKVVSEYGNVPIYGTGGLMGYATDFLYDKPSVLIGRKGTISKVKYVEQPFWTVDTLFYTVINTDLVIPKYLYYVMLQLDLNNYNEGTTIPSLRRETLYNLEFDIPPIDEQKKIISCLKPLEEKIVNNNEINNNLEQQAQALYQELFITNANPEWKTGTINDIGTVVGGSTPSKSKPEYYTEKGIAWITPKDLSVNKFKFVVRGENDITETGLKNSSASIMPKGTVLFSSRAPIGYIAIAAGEVTTNQGFKSVVPKPEIGTPFIYYFLKANLQVIEGMASGSTFKEVSGSTMKIVPAFIPDVETISSFNDFCIPLFAQQRVLEEQNKALSSIRDGLLPKLMSGELDVSDIDL